MIKKNCFLVIDGFTKIFRMNRSTNISYISRKPCFIYEIQFNFSVGLGVKRNGWKSSDCWWGDDRSELVDVDQSNGIMIWFSFPDANVVSRVFGVSAEEKLQLDQFSHIVSLLLWPSSWFRACWLVIVRARGPQYGRGQFCARKEILREWTGPRTGPYQGRFSPAIWSCEWVRSKAVVSISNWNCF